MFTKNWREVKEVHFGVINLAHAYITWFSVAKIDAVESHSTSTMNDLDKAFIIYGKT